VTLVLNEIHMLDGLKRTVMIAAADRRLTTTAGKHAGTHRKLFPIPYHWGALSYFGLATFQAGGKLRSLSEWLPAFIRKHSDTPDLRTFCRELHAGLEGFIPASVLEKNVSGFQICGYDKDLLPEYWFLTNIRAMNGPSPTEIKATYKAPAPHFRQNDVRQRFGWDGTDPASCRNGIQTYRHGDFRAHSAASDSVDNIVRDLSQRFPEDFRSPRSLPEYRDFVRFKFEFIAYIYKKWAKRVLIGGPIDVLAWHADAVARTVEITTESGGSTVTTVARPGERR
jgi:hypothetical protein